MHHLRLQNRLAMNRRNRPSLVVAMMGLCVLALFINCQHALAQSRAPWTAPTRIPEYKDATEETPFLFALPDKSVVALNSQPLDLADPQSIEAVFVRRWTPDSGWTQPIDELIVPGAISADLLDAWLDESGVMHVLLQAAEELYYSSVPLVGLNDPKQWSKPEKIASGLRYPYAAAIIDDANGVLNVLFGGSAEGFGLYATKLEKDTSTWSEPELLYGEPWGLRSVADIDLYRSVGGTLHVLWGAFNRDGIGVAGRYARLGDSIGSVIRPIEIDEAGIFLGLRSFRLIEHDGTLIATYYSGKENALWWRSSADDGVTWSQPQRVSPQHVGTNGAMTFAVDSNDNLYGFFGQRTDDQSHGMWQVQWTGNGWTIPLSIVQGAQVRDRIGGDGFDPRSPAAVIVNGRYALVTWATDGIAGVNGVWFAQSALDSPELPVVQIQPEQPLLSSQAAQGDATRAQDVPLAEPTALPQALYQTVALPTVVTEVPDFSRAIPERHRSLGEPLVFGLIPVGVVLGVWVLLRRRPNKSW